MRVQVSLYASLKPYLPHPEAGNMNMMDLKPGTTILALLSDLQVPLDKVKIIFLNGVLSKMDREIKEGDRLGVFPPVAGG